MDYSSERNNRVYLMGEIVSEATFSHEVYGEGFYELFVKVMRLSGQADILPVTISERLIRGHDLKVGSTVCALGQFRSYNKLENGRSRLMLTVFVREIADVAPTKNPNSIVLSGYLCKPPVYRTTPFNREMGEECPLRAEPPRGGQGRPLGAHPEPRVPEKIFGDGDRHHDGV